MMRRVDARQAADHQQFDLAAKMMVTDRSPEVEHDSTSSEMASTMIPVAKDCLVSVQMCCH